MATSILKTWREKNAVSQVDLAERLGVSQALVSHYENVGLPASVNKLRHISEVTGIRFSLLLDAV